MTTKQYSVTTLEIEDLIKNFTLEQVKRIANVLVIAQYEQSIGIAELCDVVYLLRQKLKGIGLKKDSLVNITEDKLSALPKLPDELITSLEMTPSGETEVKLRFKNRRTLILTSTQLE